MSSPRGIRNNNPLNIRINGTKWEGLCPVQTDKSFFQFRTMAYGYRAAIKTIQTYFNKYGLKTIRRIIHRWAPPCENDTENYIRTVLLISGLGGMENLPQPSRKVDEERLVRLIGAMTCVECGIRYKEVDWNAIRKGYELAFPGKRSYARTKPVPQESTINLTPDEIEDLLMWDEYRYW